MRTLASLIILLVGLTLAGCGSSEDSEKRMSRADYDNCYDFIADFNPFGAENDQDDLFASFMYAEDERLQQVARDYVDRRDASGVSMFVARVEQICNAELAKGTPPD